MADPRLSVLLKDAVGRIPGVATPIAVETLASGQGGDPGLQRAAKSAAISP
jgi:hypothetical protein